MQMLNFPSPYRQGEAPYDIFKDRMSAITTIVQGIKGRILNKYNKGLMDSVMGQLNKSLTPDQATEEINLLNADPGEEIYPGGIEEIAGQFVDTFNIMGKLAQGGLSTNAMGKMSQMMPSSMAGTPTTGTSTSEVMLPKGSNEEIFNAMQNMPDNQMDFKPMLKYMEEHRPGFMGDLSSTETWVMNQAMGQISDPKEKLGESLDLAKKYKELFEEPEKKRITNEVEMFLETPDQWKQMQDIKASYKDETRTAWEIKVDTLLDWRDKGVINDAELRQGIGIGITPEKKTDWEKKLDILLQLDPSSDELKQFLNARVTPEKPDELKDLTGSDINTFNKMFYGDDDSWGAITPDEYAEAKDSWERTNKDKPVPEHLSILEKALQDCLNTDNTIISRGEKNKVTDEWFKIYEWIYPYYKDALKGQSPQYLPPEEIKKVGGIEGAFTGGDVQKGDYGSALVGEGKEKDEKGYIVGQTYRDEEGILWKYLGNDKWEEVEEQTKKKSGKR